MAAVFSSAALMGYYEAVTEIPPVVRDQPAPPSLSIAQRSEQLALIKTPVPSKRAGLSGPQASRLQLNTSRSSSSAGLRQPATAPRTLARQNQTASNRNQLLPEPRVDRGFRASVPRVVVDASGSRKDTRDDRRGRHISDSKGPRLVAMLKTTWRVIKKPFKF